ncbi:uncharacterized protein LOC119981269 [Tripterygium wilfordii]|uniref:uncharacterized protein LOC119981269 n=1 Tax=Tripterygium wilfordii TaxID=458696 RepID=UPI0018F7FBC9|nr:uncharacterized protein LOC119981269 [Tripterygium wilfordii]
MWSALVMSESEYEYEFHLAEIELEFYNYPMILIYLKDVWLTPYKEKFVSAWTNRCMHFGNTTTNRAESQHANLKLQLRTSQGNFESTIHNLLECQFTAIKSTLEKSLNVVQHRFRTSYFEELRGFVSEQALQKILEEMDWAKIVGLDIQACRCIVRLVHGLPCVHEISLYAHEKWPIPLSSVDHFWKKLDFKPSELLEDDGLNFIQNTRGRPSLRKKDKPTRRDPSAFEYVEASLKTSYVPHRHSCSSIGIGSSTISRRGRPVPSPIYVNQFPLILRRYVVNVIDVTADGNCGFRAIAGLLGLQGGEFDWSSVRRDLIEKDCWMNIPDMGHLIASRYNIILHLISDVQSLTFLPLRSIPPPHAEHRAIIIGYVNGNHFVQVFMSGNYPMPPIMIQWFSYKYDCATAWATPYKKHLRDYEKLVHSINVPQSIVDITSD